MSKPCLLRICFGCLCLLSSTLQAAEQWLLLTTPTMQPLSPLISSRLADAGIQAHIRLVPQARLVAELARQEADGAFLLTDLVAKAAPGIVPVPVVLHQYELMAVTQDAQIQIRKPADLAPYRVGLLRGSQISEQVSVEAGQIYRARSVNALVEAFAAGRFDVLLLARDLVGRQMTRVGVTRYQVQEPPLASKPLYLMVATRHRAALPALTRIFQQAVQQGSWPQEVEALLRH